MEAECARADLEYLRQDVWDQVRPGAFSIFRRHKLLSALIAFSRPAFLALLIILMAVVPLSREIPAPAVKYDRSKIVLAEPVLIIREDNTLMDINTPVNPVKKVNVKEEAQAQDLNTVSTQDNAGNTKRVRTPEVSTGVNPSLLHKLERAKLLPYDQVISLMQTGQKALKNNNSMTRLQD